MVSCNIISFPRSGQHLLNNMLEYVLTEHNLPYKYCEFYSCCRTVPCSNKSNFMKHHDFETDYTILPKQKYIVLSRKDIILQLEAWYRFHITVNSLPYDITDLKISCVKNKSYYNRFIQKWVNNDNENILKIEYYDLVENPKDYMRKIMEFLYPDIELKETVLEKMVNHLKIEVKHTLDPIIYNELKKKLL